MAAPGRLRIIHVVRSPIGGIFRHIADLATAQAAAGHEVGLVCDASTGGEFEDKAIAALAESSLALRAARLPMKRNVSPADLKTMRLVTGWLAEIAPDIIHCHGAKGGIYGRLIGTWLGRRRPVGRIYAPHGGSMHYDERSLEGRFYFGVERGFEFITDALVHVSAYEQRVYRRKVGVPRCQAVVVLNGLREEEYEPVRPMQDARDLLYLGMMRDLKGIDVFLDAIAALDTRHGRRASAHIVGQADELPRYQAQAEALGIAGRIRFHDPKPTRQAFAMARSIVVPSRAESMPYVVLEAIAGAMPIIATNVGGIPEIFGPRAGELVPPGDADALADAMEQHLLANPQRAQREAAARREWLKPRFHIRTMQGEIDGLYREVLARRRRAPAQQPEPAALSRAAAWRRYAPGGPELDSDFAFA
jgi:glycosyltransferase involved in cell wall biosynthesis